MAGAGAAAGKAAKTGAAGTSTTSTGTTPTPTTGGVPQGGAPAQPGQTTTTPAGDRGGKSRSAAPPARNSAAAGRAAGTVNFGAGFILGLAFWVWVGAPFLKGGPGAVRDQLRAKFFNKDAKGNWLP